MINRLKVLYELQNIDDQLDDLEELRGDLPKAVEDLEAQIESIKSTISEKEQQRKESMGKRASRDSCWYIAYQSKAIKFDRCRSFVTKFKPGRGCYSS